jgi:hypothetical protein
VHLSANPVHVRALNQKVGAVSRTLRDNRTCMVQYYGFGAASAAGKCGRGVGGSCAEVSSLGSHETQTSTSPIWMLQALARNVKIGSIAAENDSDSLLELVYPYVTLLYSFR